MNKVIDIRERAVVNECVEWIEEALNNWDLDMIQHIVNCGFGIQLELNALRIDEHAYEEMDGKLEVVDPDYDPYGKVVEFEIFVLKNGEAVDSLTEPSWVDTEDIRERIRELYRTWRV